MKTPLTEERKQELYAEAHRLLTRAIEILDDVYEKHIADVKNK